MQTTESLIYIHKDIQRLWRDEYITIKSGWRSHREVSRQLNYGASLIELCERSFGVYAWAPEFANVHSTFPYEEKSIVIDGEEWPHSEGYFQAMKAFRTKDWKIISEEIRGSDPMMSWSIGNACKLRPDWERVKDDVMMTALREKFKDPFLKDLLLSTGDLPLVQLKYCPYWGSGPRGEGKNKLGVLLQKLRKEIKN
jgi:N-glycosidase YbiA